MATKRRRNSKKTSMTRRAKKLMRSGSRKLAAWVRAQTKSNRGGKRKNPVRVGAQVVGSGTGWIKAKAVKVRKVKGKGYVVDVKR